MKLQVPGIYDMPAAEYHADQVHGTPTLSHSIAELIVEQSPLHAWMAHPQLNPNYQSEERTEFDLGSAAHALLLEGEDRMAVVNADDWRTKAARELRDQARAEGKHPVLVARYADVLAMRDAAVAAIANCADLGGLTLANGRAEPVIVWREGDAVMRARIDFLFAGERVFLDYKTTADATPARFSRQLVKMGYHRQEDFYARAVRALFSKRPAGIFLAQETTKPYACSFHACAPSVQVMAKRDNDYAIATWSSCLAKNEWPSHSNRIHYAEAAPWDMDQQEERLAGIPYDPAKLFERRPREEDPVV